MTKPRRWKPQVLLLESRTLPSTTIPLNLTNWTALGPSPGSSTGLRVSGRTTAIAASPTDANTVYIAVYGGGVNGAGGTTGVFRSTNGGTTWANLTAAITTSTGYSDFEIDPSNSNVAYAAVGNAFGAATNGVYKTVNLQNTTPTWTLVPAPVVSGTGNGRTLIAVSPSTPSTVYAESD